MTDPVKRAAPENARSGPARVRTSAVHAGAGPTTWSRSPTSDASTGDWSTQVVERRWRKRCVSSHQVDRDGVPGRGDHVGQDGDLRPGRAGERRRRRDHPEAGIGGHRPRLERALARTPLARGRPASRRAAATCRRTAPGARGAGRPRSGARRPPGTASPRWPGSGRGGRPATTRCTAGPPCAAAHPTSPPTMNHTRVSTPRLWPLRDSGTSQLTRAARTDKVPRCTLNRLTRCSRRRLSGVTCLRTPFTVAGKPGPSPRASWPPTRSSIGTLSGSSR